MSFIIQNDSFVHQSLKDLAGTKVLLSFSCGKDSLASWLILREHGFDVVPFYLALVPDLEFVNHSLDYYERFFGTKIYRCLHPNFYARLKEDWYQPPTRVGTVEQFELPDFDYDDVTDGMRRTIGLPEAWCGVGTRKAESIMRAKRMKQDGLNHNRRVFTPIMDWRKDDVIACLRHYDCPLPIDYELFGRSFDGLYARYLVPIKKRFPRDYARIVSYFPMADVEFARLEIGEKHAF